MNKQLYGIVIVIVVFCMTGICSAAISPPVEISNVTFGGSYDDFGYSVKPAFNYEGVVIAGSYGFYDGTSWPYVVRPGWWDEAYVGGNGAAFDAVDVIWDGTCPPAKCSEPWKAGYIAVGNTKYTPPSGYGGNDAFLLRIYDEDHGHTADSHTIYSGTQDDTFNSVLYNDGGYNIMTGSTKSFSAGGDFDGWLVNTTPSGGMLWRKIYTGPGEDYLYSVNQTNDHGYILAGQTTTSGGLLFTWAWLVRTDPQGNKLWEKTYSFGLLNSFNAVKQTADGGYIAVGSAINPPNGTEMILVKTDSNGQLSWSKGFGGVSDDIGYSIEILPDGGYLIGGTTSSFGAGGKDAWLVRTDVNGNKLWDKTFGGPLDDEGRGAISHQGSYHIAGFTRSFSSHGGSDAWYIKTTPESSGPTGSITVTDPYGGQRILSGEPYWIVWSYEGNPGNTVKIELLKGGVLDQVLSAGTPIGNGGFGDYSWNIPASQAIRDDYSIRISSTLKPSIQDTSDGVFSVVPWTGVRIKAPNGGEYWQQGTTKTISWDYYSIPSATTAWIYLNKGGTRVSKITETAPIGNNHQGSYSWLIPSTLPDGNDYTIQMYTIPGGDGDESDASFTISLTSLKPLPRFEKLPSDPDGDGIYEDLNANGRLDFADVVLYFNQMEWIAANEPVSAFDLNGNGRIDFADIVKLFGEI